MAINILILNGVMTGMAVELIKHLAFYSGLPIRISRISNKAGELYILRIGEDVLSFFVGLGEVDILITGSIKGINEWEKYVKNNGIIVILKSDGDKFNWEENGRLKERNFVFYQFPWESIKMFPKKIDVKDIQLFYLAALLKALNVIKIERDALIYAIRASLSKKIPDRLINKILKQMQKIVYS